MQTLLKFLLFIVAVGHLVFYSSCSKEETLPKPTVLLATHDYLGKYLTDLEGNTLYFLSQDISGNSVCADDCLAASPSFYTKDIRAGAGLNAADFGTITRTNGEKQTTYKGWPLYYFNGDSKAGDTNGEGLGETLFIAKPDYTVMLADQNIPVFPNPLTKYIVDAQGRTLYYFLKDTEDISNCTGACLDARPAFINTDALILPSTLDVAKFSIIQRADGKKQLAYRSRAMYLYVQDNQRGQITGQEAGSWTVSRLEWQ